MRKQNFIYGAVCVWQLQNALSGAGDFKRHGKGGKTDFL